MLRFLVDWSVRQSSADASGLPQDSIVAQSAGTATKTREPQSGTT